MGNVNKSKKEPSEVETLLTHTYKNTDLEFSHKEILSFKLRINDAEQYFYTKFDFFFYFNNYLFRERLSILYDNFNYRIENFCTVKNKENFSVLVDFDDETDNIARGSKMDFDSLFTIVFEKLEISVILFFDMTNVDKSYITDFFYQLVESVDLYKYNRKFDCLYFLMPNTDYIVKNDSAFMYVTQKKFTNKKIFFNEDTHNIRNDFHDCVFNKFNNEKLISSRYPKVEGNNFIEYFIEKSKPTQIKCFMNFNFLTEIESFILENEDQFKTLELIIQLCQINIITIYDFNFLNEKIFEIFLKKLTNLLDKSNFTENLLILKLFINTNKFSNFNVEKCKSILEYLINDIEIHNLSSNRRKLVIEIFEFFQINPNSNRESYREEDPKEQIKQEISYDYTKVFTFWFLNNKSVLNVKMYFNILISKFKKLKEKKIFKNIKDFIYKNHNCKVSKDSRTIVEDELIHQ